MRLHHVLVTCPPGGVDDARRFYGDVLGLPEIDRPASLSAAPGCWFRAGDADIHIGEEKGFQPDRKGHPAFLVDDVDAVARRVARAGLPVDWDERLPGHRRFYTTDGNGNRVEILTAT